MFYFKVDAPGPLNAVTAKLPVTKGSLTMSSPTASPLAAPPSPFDSFFGAHFDPPYFPVLFGVASPLLIGFFFPFFPQGFLAESKVLSTALPSILYMALLPRKPSTTDISYFTFTLTAGPYILIEAPGNCGTWIF